MLSKENQPLLKVIAEQQPQSVTELVALPVGRSVICQNTENIGKYSLVEMEKSTNRLAVKMQYQSMLLLIQPLE